MILFGDSMDFCHNCLDHVISPIPCSTCSGVVFCSFLCLEESKSRHVNDCSLSFMDLILSQSQGAKVHIINLTIIRFPYWLTLKRVGGGLRLQHFQRLVLLRAMKLGGSNFYVNSFFHV